MCTFVPTNLSETMNKRLLSLIVAVAIVMTASAQTSFSKATTLYVMHSSGKHLEMGSDNGGWIEASTKANPQQMTITPVGNGYYTIQVAGKTQYLSKTGSWNSTFGTSASADEAKWSIEPGSGQYVKLRCKANNRYLGTDSNDPHQKVYTDKDGADIKHLWYFSEDVMQAPPVATFDYMVSPQVVRQHFDGWGVSLCWWAGQCGKWSDQHIDEIVDWMVSPTGLNYSHFRYNIGGGDDPANAHCDQHHMGRGKGLRAEMEGFKDFSGDDYHWDRDAAQRKIMLKIKEKRPDAVFEAFSNSCPYYMTYSGCVSGNTDGGKDNLKPEYYEEFAHYLVDVCKHYKEEFGIEFKTLEPFNESVTNFWYANGPQEGCHFDYQSQIKFVRVLEPILRASGLNTVISASDETNIGLSVEGFKQFKNAGVLSKVGQWNTHTYSGNNADRARLALLAHQSKMPLWMSETGSGGNGIGGNLALAQRLFDDMRYIQPEAWIDWQYMEEANDQWCTIQGSFANQTYKKVKNYYVRQHCTRFIRRGYDIITSPCSQSLCAVNANRDTLVVVLLNEGAKAMHNIDLSLFTELPVLSNIKAYRTSASENLLSTKNGISLNGNTLSVAMPAQSIVTLVIPARSAAIQPEELLRDGGEYIIIPREPGDFTVPAASFSYFDPKSHSYKTLTTDSYKMKVEKGKGGGVTTSSSNQKDIKFLSKDIRYIKTNGHAFHPKRSDFYGSSWFYVGMILPFLLLIIFIIVWRKRMETQQNVMLLKDKRANKVAKKRLKRAGQLLKAGQKEEFYVEISQVLWGYMSDKFHIPLSQLSMDTVEEKLREKQVNEDDIKEFLETLNQCEFARFAPGDSTQMMSDMYQRAHDFMTKIERR